LGGVFLFLLALFQTEIWGNANLTFQDTRQRLLDYVRHRIHSGELTERGFARLVGISQPHAHNVLNGVRNLSIEISDSILKNFHVSILDLIDPEDLEANLKRRRALEPLSHVSILENPIGPGIPWRSGLDRRRRFPTPLPIFTVPPTLVMARVLPDPQMTATLMGTGSGPYDIAILDNSERQRAEPSPEGLYAVERAGEVVLRYLRPGVRCYYLVTDASLENPARWEHLSISRAELPGLIKARVFWLGREKDRDLAMLQRGRFLYELMSS
jgi:transcriptional regulator with XRE-family HTH domain